MIWGQLLFGADKRPQVDQSGVFADIQPSVFDRFWVQRCFPGKTWEEVIPEHLDTIRCDNGCRNG